MVVNVDQLLLVRRELAGRALEREEDGVGRRAQSNSRGALLDSLERVLDLVQLALRRLSLARAQARGRSASTTVSTYKGGVVRVVGVAELESATWRSQ